MRKIQQLLMHDSATQLFAFGTGWTGFQSEKFTLGSDLRDWVQKNMNPYRMIREFGDALAIHPDVYMAASDKTPVMHFAEVLRQAGITLTDVDGRLVGSGGAYCADPWQRLIDERADQLRRLAPVTVVTKPTLSPTTTVTLDDPRLTEFDRMAARQWGTWVKNQQEEDESIANAKRNRWAKKMQPELMEVE